MPLSVKSARWLLIGNDGEDLGSQATSGRTYLEITFHDGRRAWTDEELKFLELGVPAVYLVGDEFDDVVTTFTHPERGERITVPCLTDDPVVVRLAEDFIAAVRDGTFRPRHVIP